MRRRILLGTGFIALLLMPCISYGQSLKDLLNSDTFKNAAKAVTGGSKVTAESLRGTWVYVKPSVKLDSDNALKDIAGSLASTELEKKLKEYCAKVGIVEGLFNYTFNEDGTFTNTLKKKTMKGTYTINTEAKTVELRYAVVGKVKMMTLTAHVIVSDKELNLLFNADKILKYLTALSSLSNNSTLQTINKLASEYNGLMLGFDLKK